MSTDYECNGDVEPCRFCGMHPESDKIGLEWIAFCRCNDNCFVGNTKAAVMQKWNDYHDVQEETPKTETNAGSSLKKV